MERAGDPVAAERAYAEAVRIDPGLWQAWVNLGALYLRGGALDQALAALGRALRLRPTDADVWGNLGAACRELGLHDKAAEAYDHAVELRPGDARLRSARMFSMLYRPGSTPADWLREGRAFETAFRPAPAGPHANVRDPGRRLRVGYLGADFRDHAQALFLAPLLDHHDRREVEVHVFDVGGRADAVTERLRRKADVWHDLSGGVASPPTPRSRDRRPTPSAPGQEAADKARGPEADIDAGRDVAGYRAIDDEAVAGRIRAAGIDILVDLTLHMAGGRPLVVARGPAPVRVAYLAYPATTGLSWYTHRIVDVNTEPPGAPSSERLLVLPQTFWCYDPLEDVHGASGVSPLPALSGGGVTFAALNAFSKVTPETLAMWAGVLREVEGSRLVMLAPEGSARRRVAEAMTRAGVDAGRIEFTTPLPRREYLAVYARADVALDTWPVGGHTTTLDALWMGVPVVSREGPTALGRAGRTLLGSVGLGDLVTGSAEAFISAAAGLTRDLPRLAAVRAGLRERMSSSALMDGPGFAREMEAVYRAAWVQWCDRGQQPE